MCATSCRPAVGSITYTYYLSPQGRVQYSQSMPPTTCKSTHQPYHSINCPAADRVSQPGAADHNKSIDQTPKRTTAHKQKAKPAETATGRRARLKMHKLGKLDPNKAPPVPEHLKAAIGEIEECAAAAARYCVHNQRSIAT